METIRSRSHFNKLTFCGIMLICLMFFSSCENFLNGGKVRDEILDTVAYNNAPESTVFFSAQDKMGSFLVTGRQTLKLGYEWQVQFTVNTQDYVFECLEAVSSEDSSKSLADFVSFRTIKEDAQRGIYTINVKLIKQAKDILIRPKCKQLPKIEQITPAFESYGCYQSKPIKITFNKALNEESFNNTYKTILSEYSETDNLEEFFLDPCLIDGGKTICIRPNEKHILDPNGERSSMSVFVRYDFSTLTDCEGFSINQSGVYEYRISKEFEGQKVAKIYMQGDKGVTLSLNEGQSVNCTIGYTKDLNFSIDTDSYVFYAFEAVDYTNPETSLNDKIQIDLVSSGYKEGSYIAHVWAKDDIDKALIIIKTFELPRVEDYSPAFVTEGVSCNKGIQIHFNTKMDASIVSEVKLEASGDDKVSECFEKPVLSQDGKTLTIKPKVFELSDYISLKASYLDIEVSFTEKAGIKQNDTFYKLKQDDNSKFIIRYIGSDNNAPVKNELFILKKKRNFEDESTLSDDNKFTQLPIILDDAYFTETNKARIIQNWTTGTFYVYGNYRDVESGIAYISVGEKYLYDIDGSDWLDDEIITADYELEKHEIEFTTDDENNTEFCFKHTLDYTEGVVQVTIYVEDLFGNVSEAQSFILFVKQYFFDEPYYDGNNWTGLNPYNFLDPDYYDTSDFQNLELKDYDFDKTDFEANVKNLKIKNADLNYELYRNISLPVGKLKIFFECNDGSIKQEFTSYNEDDEIWDLDLNVETVTGLHFKIIVSDGIDYSEEAEFDFPSNKILISDISATASGQKIDCELPKDYYYADNELTWKPRLIQKDANENLSIVDRMPASYHNQEMLNSCTYPYFLVFYKHLFIELVNAPDIIQNYETHKDDDETIDIESFDLTFDGNDTLHATVTLKDDIWDTFDSISYSCYGGGEELSKNTYSFSINLSYKKLEEDQYFYYSISISGIKNSLQYNDLYNIKIDRNLILEKGFDTFAPIMNFSDKSDINQSYYQISLNNDISGVKSASYTLGSVTTNLNLQSPSSEDYKIYNSAAVAASVESLKNGVARECHITYNTEDNSDNVGTGEIVKELKTNIKPSLKIEVSGSNLKFSSETGDSQYSVENFRFTPYKYKVNENGVVTWEYVIYYLNDQPYYLSNINLQQGTNCYSKTIELNKFTPNAFYKITKKDRTFNPQSPQYYYIGIQNTGDYDGIMLNGNSKTSVMIQSDAPVLVKTVYTKKPYSECSKWSIDEWGHDYRNSIGLKLLEFSDEEHSSKRYNIPIGDVSTNDYNCYCVLVYYADGTSDMSQIWQK